MHPDARARLNAAIERKNAERGRPLTAREKLENLVAWLCAPESIHDRADESSDADCYLAAVLKGAADGTNFAGGRGTVEAARSIKHTHSTHPDIARPGDGTGL